MSAGFLGGRRTYVDRSGFSLSTRPPDVFADVIVILLRD